MIFFKVSKIRIMQSCGFYKTSDYVYNSLPPIHLILLMIDWKATGIIFLISHVGCQNQNVQLLMEHMAI